MNIIEFLSATNGKLIFGTPDTKLNIKTIVTDSRKLDCEDVSSCAFIGIKGERFDGNDFVKVAIEKGTALVISDRDESLPVNEINSCNSVLIKVNDSLVAYGDIAKEYRKKLSAIFVAVTGSVGKTTTKEYIYSVLCKKFNTVKTPENHNNEIGVPATILSISEDTEAAVIEMGMRGFNQIDYLRKIALPHIGVITNIGMAHQEIMGTKENTLKAKLEIAGDMTNEDILIVNGDDELLSCKEKVNEILKEKNANPKMIYFGIGENCDVRGTEIELLSDKTVFSLEASGEKQKVTLNAPGIHNVYAALSAAAVGISMGISLEEIAVAVSQINNRALGRQEVKKNKGFTLIDDCYNAGPESVKASLSILEKMDGERKVAFLGDMLELGQESSKAHREVGVFAAKSNVKLLVCVGERAKEIGEGAKLHDNGECEVVCFENSKAAAEEVSKLLCYGDTILVKGSHAMKMGVISESILSL